MSNEPAQPQPQRIATDWKALAAGALALILGVGLVIALSTLGSRAPEGATTTDEGLTVIEVEHTLRDGRTITCLSSTQGRSGGLSCDWSNPR